MIYDRKNSFMEDSMAQRQKSIITLRPAHFHRAVVVHPSTVFFTSLTMTGELRRISMR